jgi:hypothetical protein
MGAVSLDLSPSVAVGQWASENFWVIAVCSVLHGCFRFALWKGCL